jgi:predicted transposase YbfD/YdcC
MEYNELYELMDIVLLVICAIIGGAEGWEAIEEFGKEKLEWLRQFAPLAKGVPSHEVIAGVISRLSMQGFQQCFTSWTGAVMATTGGKPIAVDGKTARGLRHRKRGHKALQGVSAWADANRLVLGHAMTEEKSNEIAAISKSLELLERGRRIVTLDAAVCQRQLAAQIIGQGGDYVLGLNDHQSAMRQAVEDFFSMAGSGDFAGVSHDFCVEVDKNRGRLEMRRYWITEELRILPEAALWMGLRSIGMVERLCSIGGAQSVERHFFLSSIAAEATRFAGAVRGRWSVENRLHWRLDIVFSEDARRIGAGNASAILTPIRRLCMSLFECEPSSLRLSQKRRKAAWNDDYRAKVVFG